MAPRRLWLPPVVPARPAGGWQATGRPRLTPMMRPRVVGLAGYQPVQGVPLQPANGQATIAGWAAVSGTFTGPGAFQTIIQTPATIPAGTYTISWSVSLSGTLGAADANNMRLVANGATFLAESVNPDTAGTYPQAPVTHTFTGAGGQLSITAGPTTGTAGAVYGGSLPANGPGAVVQLAPAGLGNIWYPTQVTLATSTGILTGLDTSVANLYLGPSVSPATLLGTVTGGNGVVATALPNIQPGQYLIAVWTGGNIGDAAVMNILGSMDALA
jgi:hypothetical protein